MNENQFLKTMIEIIKYDDEFQNKDDILSILRYSIVTFRKMQELVREVAVVMSAMIFDAVFMWTRSSLSHLTRIYKTIDNYLKISYNLLIITNFG